MDTEENYCKHFNIHRNCPQCFIERANYKGKTQEQEKSELDALNKTISELKIRIRKLEEYRRLQIDENRAVSKNFDYLEKELAAQKDLSVILLDKFKQVIKDEIVKVHANGSVTVRCADTGSIPKETLCMEKFTKPKTTGLTFEEALSAFKAGKKIRINDGLIPTIAYDHSPDMDFLFRYADMCRDCWEIVE